MNKLQDLEDSQMATTPLRSCLSLSKFNFSLRTCPPTVIQQATLAFDSLIRETLSDLAGGPLSDWAWKKASLPSSLGGLNLRSTSLHAPAAFIGSLTQSCSLITRIISQSNVSPSPHLAGAVSDLAHAAKRPDWSSVEEIDVPLCQCSLSRIIDEATYSSLLDSAPDSRSRALALSTTIPHAGDWLNVVPSTALGLHLHDREFCLCLDYWLGLKITGKNPKCSVCAKEGIVDSFGDHYVGCGGDGDRIHHHDSLRDVLFSAAQSPGRKPLPSFSGPTVVQLTFSSLTGAGVVLLP